MARCDNCDWVVVNSKFFIHEAGCPTGYLHQSEKCRFCGQDFEMTELRQDTCPDCVKEMVYEQ